MLTRDSEFPERNWMDMSDIPNEFEVKTTRSEPVELDINTPSATKFTRMNVMKAYEPPADFTSNKGIERHVENPFFTAVVETPGLLQITPESLLQLDIWQSEFESLVRRLKSFISRLLEKMKFK
jgi:hypothetical protein